MPGTLPPNRGPPTNTCWFLLQKKNHVTTRIRDRESVEAGLLRGPSGQKKACQGKDVCSPPPEGWTRVQARAGH